MTINLTRIYTRLGDGGETHLGDMSRVPKTDPRIEAYGTIDELGAVLGVALTLEQLPDGFAEWLRHIQNDLFDLGADIAVPEDDSRERLRVLAEQTEWLEARCDEVNATLAPLKSFVLSGGTAGGRAAARMPDGLPARRAQGDRLRRGDQRRGGPLPQPPLRSAVHPRARGQRRRGAAVGAGPIQARRVLTLTAHGEHQARRQRHRDQRDRRRPDDEQLVRARERHNRVRTRHRHQQREPSGTDHRRR